MSFASEEEVLELYTRIIRGEEVAPATLQAAKALARHYGIDTPDGSSSGGDVIIVDDIGTDPGRKETLYEFEKLFEKNYKTVLEGANNYAGRDSARRSVYLDGVNSLYSIFKAALTDFE